MYHQILFPARRGLCNDPKVSGSVVVSWGTFTLTRIIVSGCWLVVKGTV